MQINHELEAVSITAITAAQKSGALPVFELPAVQIERPRDPSKGDYALPAAMQMARLARMNPLKIAQAIADHIEQPEYIGEVTVAPPGFINFRLSTAWLQAEVGRILTLGDAYGRFNLGSGKKAQVECVSANPTGPITLGRTRGGVMGDTLARVMRAAGYEVDLEYYYNDAGRQITLLGEAVRIRYLQEVGQDVDLGADHYQGDYIISIAQEIHAAHGDALVDAPVEFFGDYAKDRIAESQKASLKRINIEFDVYFREQSLYESGKVDEVIAILEKNGYVYTQDGAKWFRSTEFGDDQDRVLVKETGEPTYRTPDMAYHLDKFQRGYDLVIDFFGPDHHATAPQVLMGVRALGYDTDFVQTILHQIISLVKDGRYVKMSTRRGTYITLDELVDEVGSDAIRYFMISRSGNSQIEFDMDLAVEQSDKNPVYYIQNAHVRCAGILRKWAAAGYDLDADMDADLSLLTNPRELSFLRKSIELSEVLEKIATTFEPHHITFYAYDLASMFHTTYEECRVLHESVPEPLRLARLRFYKAAKQLFARVLDLMGMSAPEVM